MSKSPDLRISPQLSSSGINRWRRAMRASPKMVGVGLTLAFSVISFSPTAAAEPKDEVVAATAAWAQALGEDDPEKVLPLYSSDAVLWGTISPKLRSDPAALRD